jgi:hypothetical protein
MAQLPSAASLPSLLMLPYIVEDNQRSVDPSNCVVPYPWVDGSHARIRDLRRHVCCCKRIIKGVEQRVV